MTKIGHATSDERGKYSCGQAGDQTGNEVCVRQWYNRPWNVVMWAEDPAIREKMAKAMEDACANNNIGYDQDASGSNDAGRMSLYNALVSVNFVMSKVTKKVETDCSNLVACCANCAGVQISPYIYTGNEKNAFKNAKNEAGQKVNFIIKTESKYTSSADNNPRGAILLYEGHHTAIQLENGKNWADSTSKPAPVEIAVSGEVKISGTASLAMRDYPSTNNNISNIKSSATQGTKIKVVAKSLMDGIYWFKRDNGLWFSGRYVEGIITETTCQNKKWIVEVGYKYSTSTLKTHENKTYCLDKEGWIITPDRLN